MVAWVRQAVRLNPDERLTLVDLGCGNGDFFRHLMERHPKLAASIDLVAVDGNQDALAKVPGESTKRVYMPVNEYLANEPDYDLAVMSLFTHHLPDPAIVSLIAALDRTARVGWLNVDLHRHRLSALSIAVLSRFFRMAPAVQHDGPLSVRRSFIRDDWRRLLAEAGSTATIQWEPLFRWKITGQGMKRATGGDG